MSELENVKKLRQNQGMNLKDALMKNADSFLMSMETMEKKCMEPVLPLPEASLPPQTTQKTKQDGPTTADLLLPNVTLKPWGHERILAQTDCYVVKELFVKAGCRLSEQYHEKKTETMFLVAGNCWLEINGKGFNPPKLTPVFIPPKTIYRLAAVGDCIIVEISSTELDDVVRLSDDYDRKD